MHCKGRAKNKKASDPPPLGLGVGVRIGAWAWACVAKNNAIRACLNFFIFLSSLKSKT